MATIKTVGARLHITLDGEPAHVFHVHRETGGVVSTTADDVTEQIVRKIVTLLHAHSQHVTAGKTLDWWNRSGGSGTRRGATKPRR